jgi:hypothetical protein
MASARGGFNKGDCSEVNKVATLTADELERKGSEVAKRRLAESDEQKEETAKGV